MILFIAAKGLPTSVKAHLSGRSRASFYYKHKMPAKNLALKARIEPVLAAHPYYGPKSIADELGINHKCVARIMKLFNLRSRARRRRCSKNQYTMSKTSLPNLIKDMKIENPNLVWAGDFTEFRYQRRIYYLATVMDVYTREIIGWHIATNHSVDLVMEALQMAIGKRNKTPLFFHSDHGSEYISEAYVSKLKEHGITPSNSGKGKPWQNGMVESFNGRLKEEFGDPRRFRFFEHFFEGLGLHFHDYNTKRIHSRLRMSPRAFYERRMRELGGAQATT